MSVTHGMFCLERTYDAPPARVFAAFATEEGKSRWFSGSNDAWDQVHRAFDFRVGGREALEGKWKTGMISRFKVTEQGAFLDGYDDAGSREKGTVALLERLREGLK